MAPYSIDLRSRVLRDSEAGMASKDVAAKYAVSRAWVEIHPICAQSYQRNRSFAGACWLGRKIAWPR